jgi:hypothetical protein
MKYFDSVDGILSGFMPFSAQELGGSLMLSNGNGSADKFSYANGSKVSPAQLKLLSPADHMFNNCGKIWVPSLPESPSWY